MCYTAILPTTLTADQLGNDITHLTYIFNRWLKMLKNYGKLDETGLDDDCIVISRVIKAEGTAKELRRAVQRCRDYAFSAVSRIEDFSRSLTLVLRKLCNAQENKAVKRIQKGYADQGMTERYRPLSRRLAKEKIRKIGKEVIFTDSKTDDRETTRLVRRIVEKRAAQTVHKKAGKVDRMTNRFRQSVRRATSFSLYNTQFAEYDVQLRATGTHWKVRRRKGKKILYAKFSYNTYEEAVEASRRFEQNHPDDPRPISAYRCDYCGKWHIGHTSSYRLPIDDFQKNEMAS